jgi:pimeloyl-ACP methyl ester carboxylesterase
VEGEAVVLGELARLLRPIGWRGKTPDEDALDGALLFPRDRRATSFDGTEMAYSIHGSDGPWVVLVPGLFCPDNFWRYLLPELTARYRVVVWDLRGLGASGTPRPPGYRAGNLSPDDFAIASQARDLAAILDAEGIESAALIGHSMGGQVALEAYRLMRTRVSAIVMLTAPFESPLKTFYGRDFNNLFRAARVAVGVMPRPPVVLAWRLLFVLNPAITHQLAQVTRALGPDARLEDMATYYRHMAYLDPLVMLMMAEAMRVHSAADLLPSIEVPTLVIAGALDTFTPPAQAARMHAAVPGAELVTIDGVSHGAVIEKPLEVNRAILAFLGRRVATGPAVTERRPARTID